MYFILKSKERDNDLYLKISKEKTSLTQKNAWSSMKLLFNRVSVVFCLRSVFFPGTFGCSRLLLDTGHNNP